MADREIHPLADQVDKAVSHIDVDDHGGMLGKEGIHDRRDSPPA